MGIVPRKLQLIGRVFVLSFSMLLVSLTCGCAAFLPAHSNSNKREGEKVTIKMLTSQEMEANRYEADYLKAFVAPLPHKRIGAQAAPLVGAAAAAAVGFAVDFVQKELQKEATRYEAQFGYTLAGEEFWEYKPNTTNYVQRYAGFEVTRAVQDEPQAYKFVCGIGPSKDGQMFRLAPLQLQIRKAKAKVITDEKAWWLAPTVWIGKMFRTGGHEIDTDVEIEMDGYWRGKDQELHITKLAGLKLKFPSYPLTNPPPLLTASRGDLSDPPSGWLLAPPISYTPKGQLVGAGAGTFTLKVLVTERDKSNARQYLEDAAKLVSEQKPKLVEAIKQEDKP